MAIAQLVDQVPAEVWHVCLIGASGYLPDGSYAKTPCADVYDLPWWDMIRHQFTDPETFAVRVACILKYYHFLTRDLANHFGDVLDEVSRRSADIMKVLMITLPGFVEPVSEHWVPPKCDPRDLGLHLAGQFLPAVCEYTQFMWSRSFQSLRLNDKALALYFVRVREIKELAKETALDCEFRMKSRLLFAESIKKIDQMCMRDDVDITELTAVLIQFNANMDYVSDANIGQFQYRGARHEEGSNERLHGAQRKRTCDETF